MIKYDKKILANGLTVIAHRDRSTPMAAFNLIYKVGAKHEDPSRTGFAHLFEHLMFGGSKNVPDFDAPVQMACGENNAFTNNDYTNYYITLPKENIETAFWIESDRMAGLAINKKSLDVQRKVVVEEFNQRYLNQPYGDLWLMLRPLAYTVHPYRWATIGMTTDHIKEATLDDVKAFYKRHYAPDNAILSVAADMSSEEVFELAEKWFGGISAAGEKPVNVPVEPQQTQPRRLSVTRDVAASAVTIVFHMPSRLQREFFVCDVISDLLSGGNSSRLYQSLIKNKKLFASVNGFLTGDVDPGLFVLTGHLMPGVDIEEAERAFWDELELLKGGHIDEYELEKVRNKFEAGVIFGEINVMNKAMNMGFYDMIGDIDLMNREIEIYRSITSDEIAQVSTQIFTAENSTTLLYMSDHEGK